MRDPIYSNETWEMAVAHSIYVSDANEGRTFTQNREFKETMYRNFEILRTGKFAYLYVDNTCPEDRLRDAFVLAILAFFDPEPVTVKQLASLYMWVLSGAIHDSQVLRLDEERNERSEMELIFMRILLDAKTQPTLPSDALKLSD